MKHPMLVLLLISCLNSFGHFCVGKDTRVSLYNTVTTSPTCDVQKGSAVLRGDHIKFTEFTRDNGELKTLCNFEIKSLSIYATEGITVDRNVRAPGINLFVFAPAWKIINSRQINLNGKPHTKPNAKPEKKLNGIAGTHGNPGLPGNPAGNFVGLGDQFINGENLVVSVSGGDGQDGGDGGDGADGKHGIYPIKNNLLFIKCYNPECHKGSLGGYTFNGPHNGEIIAKSSTNEKLVFRCELTNYERGTIIVLYKHCKFMIRGRDGKPSGNGGNGGPGGKPGKPGNVQIIELGVKSGIKTINNLGKFGKDGNVGKAGTPGSHGRDVELVLQGDPFADRLKSSTYHYKNISNGINGMVDYTRAMDAKDSIKIDMSECANDVAEYKGYLLETFNAANPNDTKVQFYNKITESKALMSMTDTLSLVNELRSLEKSFHKLHRSLDFLPLYQSLSNRTAEYARKPNSKSRSSADHKKVLTYLYTTILGREYNLKDRSESNLIVAIGSYLDMVMDDIKKHKEINKMTTIDKHKQQFKDSITLKTQEAQELISTEILPELESALKENVKNVELVVANIIELEKQSEKNYQLIARKKAEFESTMALSLFCEFLLDLSKVVAVIPLVGAVLSIAMEITAGTVKEGFGLNEEVNIPPTNKLYEGAKKSEESVNKLSKDAIATLSEQIEWVIKDLNENPDVFYELISHVQEIKYKLKHATGMASISNLREELYRTLKEYKYKPLRVRQNMKTKIAKKPKNPKKKEKKKDEKKDEKTDEDKDDEGVIDRKTAEYKVDFLTVIPSIGETTFGVLKKYKENKEKLAQFAEAIRKEREYANQLREHENSIRNEMGPALEMMASNVLSTANLLGGRFQVSLDVTQWKLQSKLKSIISSVKEMTKGLKVTDLFTNTFEKVKDAFEVLIKLYDRIQSFQEDQNWANYIADINSAGSTGIKIGDGKLQSAVSWLDSIISCNMIIQQYQTAVDAFKQYVFPFADLFFAQLVLPDNLNYGEDLDGLVIKAETQINHLKRKYDEYRFVAKQYDSYVGTGNFNSEYRSTRPFFVWDYKTYRKMISQLLSGKKVLVLADVKKSPPRYDAVKFSQIEINFKAKDKKTQSAINKVLQSFEISLQHMGNSYFRYLDQYFLITTGKLDFWYAFEKDRSGNPVYQSDLIQKMKNGAFMLSPYATWALQLKHNSESNRQAFEVLNKYKTLVDIELVGQGHFVYKDKLEIDIKVNQYYNPVDSNNNTKN